eukprot:5123696-Ditylum_brightwellii.AAC.2
MSRPQEKCVADLEELNELLTTAMLEPEHKIPIPHRAWWSDTVCNAHIIVQYWKIKLSLLCNKQHDESILEEIHDQLDPNQDVYQGNTQRSASAQLWLAKKLRKKCRNNSYQLWQEFLEYLAKDFMDGDGNAYKATIIQRIKDRESKQCMYQIM